MAPLIFVDADVLWSPTLRGWLFNLSVGERTVTAPAFEVVVSEDVIAEAVARWRDSNPTARGAVTAKMASHLRTLCTVVDDFDATIPFPGNDEGDIYVHAAAVASGAGYLVTNDRGFHDLPEHLKDSLPYEIYTPDDFLVLAAAASSQRIREATRAQLRYLISQRIEPRLADALRDAGCHALAAIIQQHLAVLAGATPRIRTNQRS